MFRSDQRGRNAMTRTIKRRTIRRLTIALAALAVAAPAAQAGVDEGIGVQGPQPGQTDAVLTQSTGALPNGPVGENRTHPYGPIVGQAERTHPYGPIVGGDAFVAPDMPVRAPAVHTDLGYVNAPAARSLPAGNASDDGAPVALLGAVAATILVLLGGTTLMRHRRGRVALG
jgi:hypothetical protein